MRQQTYYEAYLDDFDKIVVYLSRNSYGGSSNRFYVKDDDGNIYNLLIQSVETTQNNYTKYTLLLNEEFEIGKEYYVVHQHARAVILQYSAIVKTQRFDDMFYYDGADLGYTYNNKYTSFALWAPCASRVKLEIAKNNVTYTYEMQRTEKGVFRYSVLENLENATYVYFVRVNGEWKETIDPYGNASIENSRRSAVIDMRKIKVKDYPLPEMKTACDAIIYEVSVRDFTSQKSTGILHRGTFNGFVEENEYTKEKCTGFSYLKSLGITHVQLMPVMDFGSVNEIYPELHYNWGYDPIQYRVPEGSFSIAPQNPYDRIFGLVNLVEECHKAGIRVNLDVVFNHVYDKETHFFENTVPNYYFQMNEQGDFSNGTWCGNDIDSKRKMCAKYIVDTCIYLVKTYHIDGLRFDLMGILDYHLMNEIQQKCKALNPNFMVYGEGWDMPSFLDYRERASIVNSFKMNEVAHFSDRFRDVVKGRTGAHEVNVKGYCSGAVYLIDIMKNVMSGSCTHEGMDPMFANPRNAVNYVECHDNMTSWDKLKECCKEDSKEIRIARHKMMIAAVMFAQGIPFLHSGQEFARSKHGLSNTYEESDDVNKLDYERRNQYQDIVECTKDLIEIRKNHACLRYAEKEEVEENVRFSSIEQQVLLYQCKDSKEVLTIFFNPTNGTFHYEFDQDQTLIYYNKKIEESGCRHLTIAPFSVIVACHKYS